MNKKQQKANHKTTTIETEKKETFNVKNRHLWILTVLAFFGFYYYSTKSVGSHMDDELAHYMNMIGFWEVPSSIMGNWSKPGYKLLYVLPVLLGYKFVIALNCAVSAIGCFLAAKITQYFNKDLAIVAFVLAATQPVWIELSFRNYSDVTSGVILAAAVYFALKEKYFFSSLFISYNIFVRQEFIIIAFIFGLFLLYKKQFWAALALGIFPLLYALWTLQAKGDFFYFITEASNTSDAYAREYGRPGFNHYALLAAVCFGAMQIALLVVGIYYTLKKFFNIQWIKSREGKLLMVFIPFAIYIMIHNIFNMQSPEIGPATGGNLRYTTGIGPLVAALGALALSYYKTLSRNELLIVLGVVGVSVATFMTYEHNYVDFALDKNEEKIRNWAPFFIFITGGLLFFLPLKGWGQAGYIAAFTLIFANSELHPYKQRPEGEAVERCINKIIKLPNTKGQMVLSNHPATWFYWQKKMSYTPSSGTLDSANIESAPVGTICIWDSHYGFRPNRTPGSVKPEYFNNGSFEFKEPLMVTSKDQRFQIAVFEKIK